MTDREQAVETAVKVVAAVINDKNTLVQHRIANALLEERARECERMQDVVGCENILDQRAAELRAQITKGME